MATAASPTVVAPRAHQRSERAPWRETLAPFARPVVARSLLDIATSALPYLALSVVMYLLLDVSYLLVLLVAMLLCVGVPGHPNWFVDVDDRVDAVIQLLYVDRNIYGNLPGIPKGP